MAIFNLKIEEKICYRFDTCSPAATHSTVNTPGAEREGWTEQPQRPRRPRGIVALADDRLRIVTVQKGDEAEASSFRWPFGEFICHVDWQAGRVVE